VACLPYGQQLVKTFEATWPPAGGGIRVVLVGQDAGWLAYFATKASLTAVQVLQAMADRGAVEQLFKDVKGVGGAGQQQVRNLYASIGALTVNLLLYSVVEVWAWARGEEELLDRSRWPWRMEARRPSHADKRKAVPGEILRREIQAVVRRRTKREEFQALVAPLLHLAA
jgi:hypothetical protein